MTGDELKGPTNEMKEWSARDIKDLHNFARCQRSVEWTADFLCRTEAEVMAKATELGLKFAPD